MGVPVHGRFTKLQYSLDDLVYADVIGFSDGTFDMSRESVEVTDKDSGEGNEFIYGRYQVQLDFNGNWEEDEVSQDALLDACEAGTTVFLRWRPSGSLAGRKQYKARFLITKATQASPNKDKIGLSLSAQSSGLVTVSNQP